MEENTVQNPTNNIITEAEENSTEYTCHLYPQLAMVRSVCRNMLCRRYRIYKVSGTNIPNKY